MREAATGHLEDWVAKFDNALSEHDGNQIAAVLECGRWCANLNAVRRVRAIRQLLGPNPSLETLAAVLNNAGIGGRNLRVHGSDIVGVYKRCYCPSREQLQANYPFFCECTRGWATAVFEEALVHPVAVGLVHAIGRGDSHCEFLVQSSVPSR